MPSSSRRSRKATAKYSAKYLSAGPDYSKWEAPNSVFDEARQYVSAAPMIIHHPAPAPVYRQVPVIMLTPPTYIEAQNQHYIMSLRALAQTATTAAHTEIRALDMLLTPQYFHVCRAEIEQRVAILNTAVGISWNAAKAADM
ncbi:hypothetical protein EMMF5_004436 [Cystobasidiomycetes sp. EMM_F5]